MKKISLLMLPLALLALGSCDNNEQIQAQSPNEMGFVPVASIKSSRGYTTGAEFKEVTYENLIKAVGSQAPEERNMYISSYLTPQNGNGKVYFTNKFFKKLEGPNYWCNHTTNGDTIHAPIYWPIGGKLDFLAVSSTKNFNLTLNWDGTNPAEKVEIDVIKERCSQNDILYSGVYGKQSKSNSGNVEMTFNHAQAWLTFALTADTTIENDGAPNDTIFYLEKIVLEKAWSAGNLNIHRSGNAAVAEWNLNVNNCDSVKIDNFGSRKVSGLIKKEPKKLDMLIPQQQQCAFILFYKIKDDSGDNSVHSYRFELKNTDNWMMGQHYTYTIHLTANEITVTPTVTVWGDEEANKKNITVF